ncbi:ZIP zinc/iron transport family [Coniochaeta sp. PMI_546]|nr:ZIP zinc/iron transport family [Coniochaeta sp. PMI_546]
MSLHFNPHSVDLDTADQRDIVCYLASSEKDDGSGSLGIRISAVFVIFVASTATTLIPVLSTRMQFFHMPLYLYLFFKYFGSGVIIATAFIHLLDPAYDEIGPASCVGLTGGWVGYAWPPAIAMASLMLNFLLDFTARRLVQSRRLSDNLESDLVERSVVAPRPGEQLAYGDGAAIDFNTTKNASTEIESLSLDIEDQQRAFREKISAFLILEFGIIFHSVIIGLNLGVVGDEFTTLYPVMVFHQAFEGLGIGARLSEIPFPGHLAYLPWVLSLAYGLTTPIAIAAGMGLKTSYDGTSFTANVVSGIIDAASAGVLLYTGVVEMLARDFIFNQHVSERGERVIFMLLSLFLGAALMALLGKWA